MREVPEPPICIGLGFGADRTLSANIQWNIGRRWGFILGLAHQEAAESCEHGSSYNYKNSALLAHCSAPNAQSGAELEYIIDAYQIGGRWMLNQHWSISGGIQQEIAKWDVDNNDNLTIEEQALLDQPTDKSIGGFIFTEYRLHRNFGLQLQYNTLTPTLAVQIYF